MLTVQVVDRAGPPGADAWRRVRAPVILVLLWLGLVAVFEALEPRFAPGMTLCPFHNITGLPCPTCGATRALRSMLTGHPVQAVLWNPLLVMGAMTAAAWCALPLISGRTLVVRLSRGARAIAWIVATLAFIANWLYVIARGN